MKQLSMMFHVVVEFLVPFLAPFAVLLGIALAVLSVQYLVRGGPVFAARPFVIAWGVAAAVAALAFFLVPMWTQGALADLVTWYDWLAAAGLATAGATAFVIAYPLALLLLTGGSGGSGEPATA